jgi:hypothetical protein
MKKLKNLQLFEDFKPALPKSGNDYFQFQRRSNDGMPNFDKMPYKEVDLSDGREKYNFWKTIAQKAHEGNRIFSIYPQGSQSGREMTQAEFSNKLGVKAISTGPNRLVSSQAIVLCDESGTITTELPDRVKEFTLTDWDGDPENLDPNITSSSFVFVIS